MKICETCGKTLHSDEVFTRNGMCQCEECAWKYTSKEQSPIASNINIQDVNNIVKDEPNSWIKGMKALVIIEIIVLLIGSLAVAVSIGNGSDSFFYGLIAFVGFTVASFATVGLVMVFLHLAEDVAVIKGFIKKEYIKKNDK